MFDEGINIFSVFKEIYNKKYTENPITTFNKGNDPPDIVATYKDGSIKLFELTEIPIFINPFKRINRKFKFSEDFGKKLKENIKEFEGGFIFFGDAPLSKIKSKESKWVEFFQQIFKILYNRFCITFQIQKGQLIHCLNQNQIQLDIPRMIEFYEKFEKWYAEDFLKKSGLYRICPHLCYGLIRVFNNIKRIDYISILFSAYFSDIAHKVFKSSSNTFPVTLSLSPYLNYWSVEFNPRVQTMPTPFSIKEKIIKRIQDKQSKYYSRSEKFELIIYVKSLDIIANYSDYLEKAIEELLIEIKKEVNKVVNQDIFSKIWLLWLKNNIRDAFIFQII